MLSLARKFLLATHEQTLFALYGLLQELVMRSRAEELSAIVRQRLVLHSLKKLLGHQGDLSSLAGWRWRPLFFRLPLSRQGQDKDLLPLLSSKRV